MTATPLRDRPAAAVLASLTLFALWTLATWFLEGRIETLLRPDAALSRALYAVIANLLIGTLGALLLLRVFVLHGVVSRNAAGFRGLSLGHLGIALAAGGVLYVAQGGPAVHPVVLANLFAQVLVVSVAEVLVCWTVVGASLETFFARRMRRAWLPAGVAASVLFGIYHFAHSAPFNRVGMVLLLTGVGLMTSVVFSLSRNVYATILFHNCLGLFGVIRAVQVSGRIEAFAVPQLPLIGMGFAAITLLAMLDWRLLRRPH